LKDTAGQIAVTVEDDGVGFKQQDGIAYGLGLLGMAERVRELSGKIDIHSQPGQGTKIEVTLPRGVAEHYVTE
jgi:signal transduction histidine kinase